MPTRELRISDSDLEEIGFLLELDPGGDLQSWLDLVTGEILSSTSRYGLDPEYEEEPEPRESVPPTKRDEWDMVAAIYADETDRYRKIPIGADNGRPGKLRDFARTLNDAGLRGEVYDAMNGRGAFRRVKDLLYRRGELDLWHRFEEGQRRLLAVEWLEGEGVRVLDPTGAPRRASDADEGDEE